MTSLVDTNRAEQPVTARPTQLGRRLASAEWLLLGLGAVLTGALVLTDRSPVLSLWAGLCWFAYGMAIRLSRPESRGRLLANYLVVGCLYAGSTTVIAGLRLPLHQDRLIAWDRWWCGGIPASIIQSRMQPWMNDGLSLGYLSYLVYLHWALLDAMARGPAWRRGLGRMVFTAFAVGLIGYFVFPAAPPRLAFPTLFSNPVAGGWPTRMGESIDASLAARYDAFPSLHLLITLVLLTWDWGAFRSRFWIMLGPSLLMVAATLALREHYLGDLVAALVLYGLLMLGLRPAGPMD